MAIHIKRVYDAPAAADGTRVLLDRLWPRGVRKEDARIDQWMNDLAPSTELRRWFGHDPAKWAEFQKRYFKELDAKPDAVAELKKLARAGKVTLVYGARDTENNNAVALREYLRR